MSQTELLKVESLSKLYKQNNGSIIVAVKDLSISASSGQVLGFLGPNGAGKTTTIKAICGLVKPTTGNVTIDGFDIWKNRNEAMSRIGAVLEGTRNVYWTLSAYENIIYFGHLKGVSGKKLKIRTEHLLKELNLWERRSDLVNTFSRGMQQKVAIACALISDPPLILLDEPTLGLDVEASLIIKEMVKSLAEDQGKTVVLTTHQLELAQSLCDRVVIINKGRILADKPIKELLTIPYDKYYEIKFEGVIPSNNLPGSNQYACFAGLSIKEEGGCTTISGIISEPDHLHDLINETFQQGHALISVNHIEPNLEEVFVQMLHMDQEG